MSSILKVDTIQNTGGTTGLTIDSSGSVNFQPNLDLLQKTEAQYCLLVGDVM